MTVDPSDRVNDMFAEWDTADTVLAVRDALAERYDVTMIEADEDAYEKLRKIRPFFAFNIAEGLYGPSREGQVPSILEMLRIPYLGSDPLTLGICLVKSRAKEVLSWYGVPTAPHAVVGSMDECRALRLPFPSIVKPLHEGSSKGIYDSCVVRTARELEREVETVLSTYGEPALVEEFLPGREFTVAMMGNGEGLRLLPVVEIKFDALPSGANPIYSYEAKWIWDTVERPLDIYECPAPLDGSLREEIESICRKSYTVLRCRDWTRIDIRCDASGAPRIIEVNPLPGILPRPEDNSCFPKAARAAGMTYNELINSVLDIAMKRCGILVRDGRHAVHA
ncbi:MAG TPA: D-alanine--D-alanine ligase [Bacteroidota bacterium]|nr:D-alanine--D-alanine ligase [Bacteroidota bacterium]